MRTLLLFLWLTLSALAQKLPPAIRSVASKLAPLPRAVSGAILCTIIWALAPAALAQEKIQWYATWDMGLRQARATGRPILLIAAAPHCHNVSGIW